MHRKSSYDKHYKTWHAQADREPRALNPDGLEVRGLQQNGLIGDETTGRTARIESDCDDDINSRERASNLRILTTKVLNRVFEVEGEPLEDAELIVAELVQNAFRYSVSGPIWVSIVQIIVQHNNTTVRIVDITVANRLPLREYDYAQDAEAADEESSEGPSVHGRGSVILDALAWRHDLFEDKHSKTLGAYALMNMGNPEDGDSLTTAA